MMPTMIPATGATSTKVAPICADVTEQTDCAAELFAVHVDEQIFGGGAGGGGGGGGEAHAANDTHGLMMISPG